MIGLNVLTEALAAPYQEKYSFDPIEEAVLELDDDDIKELFVDDSVESDMSGNGITSEDEEKYEKILKNIPEFNEGMEDAIKSTTESFDPSSDIWFTDAANLEG